MSVLSVNYRNLYKLVTHEDVLHAHKILGVICLSHFMVRMVCMTLYGSMLFSTEWTDLVLVACHLLLSCSSLMFAIPSNRNKAFIVIWPEFRLHSILFASRSIACLLLDMLVVDKYVVLLGSMLTVMLTMVLADAVSNYYEHLVGGRTTMRGMSWPDRFPWNHPSYQKAHNFFYSFSQIGATLVMVDGSVEEKFMVLLPIQIAPFLSTLVKKGIVQNSHWHLVYTASLILPYAYAWLYPASSNRIRIMTTIAILRFIFHVNKYALWAILFAMMLYFYT